jgi:hypothetical protein
MGTKVILDMINGLAMPHATSIFFDNLFTSRDLLIYLQTKQMFATGTIRENRLSNFPLQSSKDMKKQKEALMIIILIHMVKYCL